MNPVPPVGPPVPFDDELATVLELIRTFGPKEFTLEGLLPYRTPVPGIHPTLEELRRDGAYTVAERLIPGPAGAPEVLVVVCLPTAATGPVPGILFLHGGGMIIGDSRTGLPQTLDLALGVGAAVVSVEYRLAPENPHPAPVEDCYAALRWLAEQAGELGVDPARLIVSGTSSGGGLAAAVALLARDRGGPALAGQLLNCPMLDSRNDTPSSHQMAGVAYWDHSANETGWTALLGEARPDADQYASPALATDLSGLPPAFIDVGSAETFRDEDVAYATAIWRAGGVAELHVWPGAFHSSDLLAPDAVLSKEARAAQARWLRRVLG
ncbi:alpha/beta hydrolase [Actinocorallia lasiicapitis]